MKSELREFLAEGLKHYKKASYVMTEFFTNTQNELQGILKKRKDWGSVFKPKETKFIKSTKYWDKYPLINAQIEGAIEGKPAIIKIAVDWLKPESEYPTYDVWLEKGPESVYKKISAYQKRGRFELTKDGFGLVFDPSPDNFDLERDFNLLIDEFVRVF